jgi:prephenate dehydrogenase
METDNIIAEKLDILIKLTAANVIKEDKTQTESILKLNGMGIKYKDIAKIIGTSESYVALILSKNKNKVKGKSKNEELTVVKEEIKNAEEEQGN